MTSAARYGEAVPASLAARSGTHRPRWHRLVPQLVLAPSVAASLVYVVVFSLWTVLISVSN